MNSFGIVGGGIAGLYTAYKLLNKYGENIHISIYEKTDKLGGRIHTIKKNGFKFDAGAGRFNNYHTYLLKLIHELGIDDKIIEPKNLHKNIYIKDSKIYDIDMNSFIKKILQLENIIPAHVLKSKTLLLLLKENFKPSEVDDFIYAFGYNNEFEYGNAYDILQTFKINNPTYYFLKGGMHSVVDSLIKYLKNKNVDFKLNQEIINLDIHNGKIDDKIFDMIFICITKNDLLKIPTLLQDSSLQKNLKNIHTRPLNRIYAKFPKESDGKIWFHDIPKISTNNMLRNIIPIDKESGLIMISYSDGLYAETWNFYTSKKELLKNIMTNVRIIFPNKIISEPEWIEKYYWENSSHWPGPNYYTYKNKAQKYRICGEVMQRTFNAWIEGALISVETIINTF